MAWKLTGNTRYRVNRNGQMILQVYEMSGGYPAGPMQFKWRDKVATPKLRGVK